MKSEMLGPMHHSWPGGIDLNPDFIYKAYEVTKTPLPTRSAEFSHRTRDAVVGGLNVPGTPTESST